MARTSYSNVLALPDAALQFQFDLFFPTIPGGGNAQNLTYKVKGTSIPTSKIEPVVIELHGGKKQEAGRAQYDHTFTCTFMETVDYSTLLAFRAWRNYMRSWKNNTGANAAAYKVNLELDVYDNAGNIMQTLIMAGAWVQDIAEVTLNGASSEAVEISITFSFDYIDSGNSW